VLDPIVEPLRDACGIVFQSPVTSKGREHLFSTTLRQSPVARESSMTRRAEQMSVACESRWQRRKSIPHVEPRVGPM
jgi:hypothetical protein